MRRKLFLGIVGLMVSVLTSTAQVAQTPEEVKPLKVGQTIPTEFAKTIASNNQSLFKAIQQKPTVLIFYRGTWCPYCNEHLSEVAQIEEDIQKLGYQIIGISPDAKENIEKAIKKNKLNYQLFSDSSTELAQKMGVAFEAPKAYTNLLTRSSEGLNNGILPVPSVFVLDKMGKILFTDFSTNYKKRISADTLLKELNKLK
ncbi:redoxin domain-containing protein [Prolixibacteraceae bacterium JC049]|nr:redoxin domain-containing protein [Prolixibacteraceae bacterium JC049]